MPADPADARLREAVHPAGLDQSRTARTLRSRRHRRRHRGAGRRDGRGGLGARVALVERALLGGDCLNTGCVPSKALLRSARAAADARRAPELGVRVAGVDADFAAVMRRMRERRADISPHDSAARLRAAGVDVYFGEARFTGPSAIERRRPHADVPPRRDRDRRPSRGAADSRSGGAAVPHQRDAVRPDGAAAAARRSSARGRSAARWRRRSRGSAPR